MCCVTILELELGGHKMRVGERVEGKVRRVGRGEWESGRDG